MRITQPVQTRRVFLRTLLAGWGAALGAMVLYPVARFLFPRLDREPEEVRLPGPLFAGLAPGAFLTFAWGTKPGILIRGVDGSLRGFKGVCTHLDCNVTWLPARKRFHCPCHEGWFDQDGRNIAGPPPRPLTEFILEPEGEELVVRVTPRPPAAAGGAA